MAFAVLGNLFYVLLLLVNAVAVLNEERFLAPLGWGNYPEQNSGFGGDQNQSVKAKLISLMSATRTLLRLPLIAINTIVIVYELILG